MVYPFFSIFTLSYSVLLIKLLHCSVNELLEQPSVDGHFFILFFSAFPKASPLILEPVMSVEVNIPQEFQVRSGATSVTYFWNCLLPIVQPGVAHRFHKPWLKISRINWTFNYSIWPCWRGTKLDYPTGRCSGNKPTLPLPPPPREEQDRAPVSRNSR